jgi:hypothetical protein
MNTPATTDQLYAINAMSSGVFSAAASNTFTSAWRYQKIHLESKRLEKYADLLLPQIMADITLKKRELQRDMLEACSEAKSQDTIFIPIWHYYRTVAPAAGYTTDTGLNIIRLGYDWTIGVNDVLEPVSVDDVISRTDICQRISCEFGLNYCVFSTHDADVGVLPSLDKYEMCRVQKMCLYLQFLPPPMAPERISWLTSCYIKHKNREKFKLENGQTAELWRGN